MDLYDIDLKSSERAILMFYRRMGGRSFILLITLGSILLSVLATLALVVPQFSLDYPDEALLPIALGIAVAVPAVIAPTTVWMLVRLLNRLDNAYQALLQLSTIDPLTGVTNRRGFFSKADYYLRTWKDTDCGLVGMVDLDAFKSLNDRFGHQFGDEALQAVAHRLQSALGEGIVGRLGGDEFAFLLTGSLTRIELVKQTIRAQCRTFTINHEGLGQLISVSTSIGMVLKEQEESFDQALVRADRALYAVKRLSNRGAGHVQRNSGCRDRQTCSRSTRNRWRCFRKLRHHP